MHSRRVASLISFRNGQQWDEETFRCAETCYSLATEPKP